MTSAAVMAIDQILHADSRCARLHLDAEFNVANRTLEANPVKPVRENDRRNTLRLGTIVEYDIRIFSPGNHYGNETGSNNCEQRRSRPSLHDPSSRAGAGASYRTVEESVLWQ